MTAETAKHESREAAANYIPVASDLGHYHESSMVDI